MTTMNNKIKNNYENKELNLIFQEEINKINKRKKELLLERKNFHKQLFKGIKGHFNKIQNPLILNKKDLISKYNLNIFMEELKKSKYLSKQYENDSIYNIQVKDPKHKIDLTTINKYYESLEEELTTTIIFLKKIKIYLNSNFQNNELLQDNQKYNLENDISIVLFKSPSLLLNHIENVKIKELGQKMIKEYNQNITDKEIIKKEIEQLQINIKSKLFLSNNESIELLKKYREILKDIDANLSKFQTIETPLTLKRTKN